MRFLSWIYAFSLLLLLTQREKGTHFHFTSEKWTKFVHVAESTEPDDILVAPPDHTAHFIAFVPFLSLVFTRAGRTVSTLHKGVFTFPLFLAFFSFTHPQQGITHIFFFAIHTHTQPSTYLKALRFGPNATIVTGDGCLRHALRGEKLIVDVILPAHFLFCMLFARYLCKRCCCCCCCLLLLPGFAEDFPCVSGKFFFYSIELLTSAPTSSNSSLYCLCWTRGERERKKER